MPALESKTSTQTLNPPQPPQLLKLTFSVVRALFSRQLVLHQQSRQVPVASPWWQAPPVFFSSLLFISEPIFLLPLLRQIQLFLYHLPILHTHCYYYIDFQCFVFQSLLLVRDSKNRVSLFSTLSVKIDTEHRFLLQFLPALYMVTTE